MKITQIQAGRWYYAEDTYTNGTIRKIYFKPSKISIGSHIRIRGDNYVGDDYAYYLTEGYNYICYKPSQRVRRVYRAEIDKVIKNSTIGSFVINLQPLNVIL